MRVRAVAVLDQVVRAGSSVVLHDGQVVELSPLATLLRALAPDWTELSALVAPIEEAVGPAPGGEALRMLTDQAGDLARAGLLEVSAEDS